MEEEIFNENLTQLQLSRMKRGLTRHFIAHNLGVCDEYYGKIERGIFTLTLDKIKVLATLFNVPDEVIFKEAMEGVDIREKLRKEGKKWNFMK